MGRKEMDRDGVAGAMVVVAMVVVAMVQAVMVVAAEAVRGQVDQVVDGGGGMVAV